MNIRTQTSKPLGAARVLRESQDYAVFSVYMAALPEFAPRPGSLAWHIVDLLQSEVAADRREETLFLPAENRAALLAMMKKYLVEARE